MKQSKYLFTKIFLGIFIVIGLFLAIFPGYYVKVAIPIVGNEDAFFEIFVPTYQGIFGGQFETALGLPPAFKNLGNNAEIAAILEQNVQISIKTNILFSIFFIVSLIVIVLFMFYAKSRIMSLITSITLIATTLIIATSNLTFSASLSNSFEIVGVDNSLGTMFLILTFSIATAISIFHLIRVLIKPNSLEQESDPNLLD